MKRIIFGIVLLGLLAGAVVLGRVFPSANETLVDLDLIAIRIEQVAIWALTLAAFGAGIALTALIATFLWLRGLVLRRRYRKTITQLEKELHEMRSMPLADAKGSPAVPPVEASAGAKVAPVEAAAKG